MASTHEQPTPTRYPTRQSTVTETAGGCTYRIVIENHKYPIATSGAAIVVAFNRNSTNLMCWRPKLAKYPRDCDGRKKADNKHDPAE